MAATTRYSRDRHRHRFIQSMLSFAVAVLIAICISGVVSADSHAAFDCTAASMQSSAEQCPAAPVPAR